MPNEYNSKVVLANGEVLIDLTPDTVDAEHLLSGYTAHDKSGAPITGECKYDSDTSDDTAAVGEILVGKTAHARGAQLTGTMPNNGCVTLEISDKNQEVIVPQGYHDGSGKAKISDIERAKLIPGNIKAGVEILEVVGEYSGEGVSAQVRSVTPKFTQQQVLPEPGFDYLSQVNVAPITVTYSNNSAGGKTVTIGAV